MSDIILDTCAFLWFIQGSPKLSETARLAIEDSSNTRHMSVASAWEMAVKYASPKRSSLLGDGDYGFDVLILDKIDDNNIEWIPVEIPHTMLIASSYDPVQERQIDHGDPFDRLIIATAKLACMSVVTGDPKFNKYGIEVIW